MLPNPFPLRLRNLSAKLDGCIRNAFPAVENIRFDDCICGAGIDTTSAGSATIRGGRIRLERKVRENAAEKQPGSRLLMDDAGVFSEPADTGILRKDAFIHRSSIDKCARPAAFLSFDPPRNILQLEFDGVVIVLAPSVTGNP